VSYWIENGLDKCKLVLGIPLYGKGYLLADKNVSAVGSPSIGSAAKSFFTNEPGLLPYFEICQLIKTRKLTEQFDDEAKLASIQIASTWIGTFFLREY
jgi:chitinase